MKKRDRFIGTSKQSTGRTSGENIWFFNEDTRFNQSPGSSNKIEKDDRFRGIREDYDPFMTKTSERNKFNNECLFVVDWQLTDA